MFMHFQNKYIDRLYIFVHDENKEHDFFPVVLDIMLMDKKNE
jgi:hypothetical protein